MEATPENDLPWTSAPAARALDHAGINSLEDLSARSWSGISRLHGVGPKALRIWKAALAEHGLEENP
ncbi:hypothetical protein GCM10009596_18940 [Arthrobacter rhombi]|uniref:hypothetical protein n=1 Tax=Arthrobacter rhombi TaxID=71253 RepID=UPI0031D809F3